MGWTGFIALGTVTGGVFVDSGAPRQAWVFGPPGTHAFQGTGPAPGFGFGPLSFNAYGFYSAATGGLPQLVYPLPGPRIVAAGLTLTVQPASVAVDFVHCNTTEGVAIDPAIAKDWGFGSRLLDVDVM